MNTVVISPSPNNFGVPLPPLPNNPPQARGPALAKDYVDFPTSFSVALNATDKEVGDAIYYNAGLAVIAEALPGTPTFLHPTMTFLEESFRRIEEKMVTRTDFAEGLHFLRGEFYILLANSNAQNGPLFDPTHPHEWRLLAPPNPTSRDNLVSFDYTQCIRCAEALGLPEMPHDADLPARRKQIAGRLGIPMGPIG